MRSRNLIRGVWEAAVLLLFSFWLTGCRPPEISEQPSEAEYHVLRDVLAFETQELVGHRVVVASQGLHLDEGKLQFARCLPRHLQSVFDQAPTVRLSTNVPENWLRTADGRAAALQTEGRSLPDGDADIFRVSRVAFSRFHRDAYVWVEHAACSGRSGRMRCGQTEGDLLRAVRDGDRWTLNETDCRTLSFSDTVE